MSGGSYSYICFRLEEECKGRMYDAEMNMFVTDFVDVLHDLEWWRSSDTDEEQYRKTLKKFKKKWFTGDRNERLEEIINEKCEALKAELIEML